MIKTNPCKQMTTHQYVKSIESALVSDYIAGLTTKHLARKYGISSATAWRRIQRAGIIKSVSEQKIGNKNPMWTGKSVGYRALHAWVSRHKVKPKKCELCKIKPPKDLANKSQQYKRDIEDFEWLCRSCHMNKDGRIKQLRQYR